jgi:uncharacterized protein (TIGR00369 family)
VIAIFEKAAHSLQKAAKSAAPLGSRNVDMGCARRNRLTDQAKVWEGGAKMADFEVHGEFEREVRASFARQSFMGLLGASLTAVEPGAVEIRMPFRADLTQHHGYLHAAVVTALLDNAAGFAAMTVSAAGMEMLSVEFKVNFLAPALGETLIARGRVKKRGRTLCISTAEAWVVREGREHNVAMLVSTVMPVAPRG